MRLIVWLVPLACSACIQQPPVVEPSLTQSTERIAPDDPNCRDYTAQFLVDGKQQDIVGRACRRSDGSWKITEGPPGNPTQFETVYPPVTYVYNYPYYGPWLYGPPVGLGFGGGFVFFDGFLHLRHELHHEHHEHHEGPHDFDRMGAGHEQRRAGPRG